MVVNMQAEIFKLGETFFVSLGPVVIGSPLCPLSLAEGTAWTLELILSSLEAVHQWANCSSLSLDPSSHLYNGMLTATSQDYCEASGSL